MRAISLGRMDEDAQRYGYSGWSRIRRTTGPRDAATKNMKQPLANGHGVAKQGAVDFHASLCGR